MKRNTLMFLAYGALIAFVSLRPADGISVGSYDKITHFATYAVLAMLAARLRLPRLRYVVLLHVLVLYGGVLEFAQSFVPGRHMSGLDFLANTLGIVAGAIISAIVLAHMRSRQKLREEARSC